MVLSLYASACCLHKSAVVGMYPNLSMFGNMMAQSSDKCMIIRLELTIHLRMIGGDCQLLNPEQEALHLEELADKPGGHCRSIRSSGYHSGVSKCRGIRLQDGSMLFPPSELHG